MNYAGPVDTANTEGTTMLRTRHLATIGITAVAKGEASRMVAVSCGGTLWGALVWRMPQLRARLPTVNERPYMGYRYVRCHLS